MIPVPRDVERTVLNAALYDPAIADAITETLDPDDFGHDLHRQVFEVIKDLRLANQDIDTVLVAEQCAARFRQDFGRIAAELTGWSLDVPPIVTVSHVQPHVDAIKTAAANRLAISLGQEIASLGMQGGLSATEVVAEIERRVRERTERHRRAPIITPSERRDRILTRQHERQRAYEDGQRRMLSTGFDQLDQLLGGLGGGRFYVVGGWSGDGKSTFMLSVARHVAAEGYNVLYVTEEMDEEHVSDRELAAELGINSQKIEAGALDDEEWSRFAVTAEEIGQGHIYVYDQEPIYVEDLADLLWTMERRYGGAALLITDYLQILATRQRFRSREEEVAYLATTHRRLAKQFGIPVMTGSQFNDEVIKRTNKRPTEHDFRESRRIVHEAWALLGLYVPSRHGDKSLSSQRQWDEDPFLCNYLCPEYQTEIVICKQRSGPRDVGVRIGWDRETASHYQPLRKQARETRPAYSSNGNGYHAPVEWPEPDLSDIRF